MNKELSLTNTEKENFRRWFDARAVFLGDKRPQSHSDFEEGLKLAKESEHPDAKWLYNLFPKVPSNLQEVEKILLSSKDARGLCFAGLLMKNWDLVKQAAELGYPYAQ